MASSLSSFVDNLTEGINKIKCKYWHDSEQCKRCGIKQKDCDCYLEYINAIMKKSLMKS